MLLFIMVFGFDITLSAENTSFVQEGKQWKTEYHNGYLNDHLGVKHLYHYDFVMEGDTLIHSKTCKKMYVDSSLDGSRKEYLLAMYEEGKKVYAVPKDATEGLLLYDFGAETGDKIEVYTSPNITPFSITYQPRPETMHVLDVVTRVYHGVERRCLYVIAESNYQTFAEDDQPFTLEDLKPYSGWWIEGIGTEGYPFNNTSVGMLSNGGSTWLCMAGADTLYTNGTFDPTAGKCLVDGGMSWIQRYTESPSIPPEGSYTERHHFYFKEDEEIVKIGGHSCRMLYAAVLGEEQDEHIVAALYEEDGRVYCYPWRESEEAYLLYDFRANVGDELTVGVLHFSDNFEEKKSKILQWPCRVVRVTEEDFMGIKRRCLYLQEAVYGNDEYFYRGTEENACWIEGIGSTFGVESSIELSNWGGRPLLKLQECRWMDDVYYANEGNTFTAATDEGITLIYTIVDEVGKKVSVDSGELFVPAIEKTSFRGSFSIPSEVNGYQVVGIGKEAFVGCDIDSVIMPEGLEEIGSSAFAYCKNMKYISIPSTVKKIGDGAFHTRGNLTSVVSCIKNPENITIEVWIIGTENQATLYVPEGTKSLYQNLNEWQRFSNIVEMESTGINSMNEETCSRSTAIYDLTGCPVTTPMKGVYIQNGKKVMMR